MPTTSSSNTSKLSVFLCHATEDKPAIRKLYNRLCSDGIKPWLDEEELLPGENWREIIPKVLIKCHAVIVCISTNSVSKTGYVNKEIKYSLDILDEQPEDSVFVIPVKIENCETPFSLKDLHHAELYKTGGYDSLLTSLKKIAMRYGF